MHDRDPEFLAQQNLLGFHTERVSEPAEVIPALRWALDVNKSDRPAYIEFILSSSAASTPSMASRLDGAAE